MQRNQSTNALYSAAFTAGLLTLGAVAQAAPATYQAAVTNPANSPYVYYRFGETGIADGASAADSSGNGRNGEYNGAPTGGVTGTGLGSDNAVQFSGGSGATGQYLASPVQGFGNSVGTSSYEFLYKTNPGFSSTTMQSLFGVFSPSAAPLDVEVTLNSRGNDFGGLQANTTRLYIKGQDGDGAGVHFTNPTLYDGNYHHLVFTFDAASTGVDAFSAYVDGIEQTLTFSSVAATATDGDSDPDTFAKNFDFIPTFAGRNVRGTTIDGNGLQRLANVTLDEAALYGTVLSEQQIQANATAAGFVVPEPGSLALAGIAGLGLLARRRRQA